MPKIQLKEITLAMNEAILQIPFKLIKSETIVSDELIHKRYWHDLMIMFRNFYTGKSDLFKDIVFIGENKKIQSEKNALKDEFDYFHDLYNMLVSGWCELELAFTNLDASPKSPAEAFKFIIVELSKNRWANRNQQANATTLYRAWLTFKSCETNESAQVFDEKKLDTLIKRIQKKSDRIVSEGEIFLELCIDICSRSKKKYISREVEQFKATRFQRADSVAKSLRYDSKK